MFKSRYCLLIASILIALVATGCGGGGPSEQEQANEAEWAWLQETQKELSEVTALRETREEVGIEHHDVTVIGYLEPMPTITGYAVTPVVGLVDSSAKLILDRTEVEFVFEVPLPFLLDPQNKKMVERDVEGRVATLAEFHYGGQRIWGATAFIILQFIKKIKNNKL